MGANPKNEAGNNRGVNKELVLFLLLEFQENGDVAQSCAERAPGSRPSTQRASPRVTGSLGDRQWEAAATQAL